MNKTLAVTVPDNTDVNEFSKEISSVIIDEYENILLKKIADTDFAYLSAEEREKIYLRAKENAKTKNGEILSTIHYNRRRMLIEESLRKFFSEQKSMNLEGFVNFRLDCYKEELREMVVSASEEIQAELEYEEFLDMLRFFVSVQYPKERTVHIVKKKDGLHVLNQRKKDITKAYLSDPCNNEKLTNGDVILSALIGIAPEKIIVHDSEENEIIYSTIKKIFPNVLFRENRRGCLNSPDRKKAMIIRD